MVMIEEKLNSNNRLGNNLLLNQPEMKDENESKDLLNMLGDDQTKKADPMIDQIYEQINNVLGGDNSEQYFCLTFPGTVLNKEDYKYDVTAAKPLKVEANESKLLNQLFDPCHITGSNNGRMLATQYLTALDALTPKLNPNMAKTKNTLRDMLNSSYNYYTDDGQLIKGTLQQIFYRLYGEYVLEKQNWAEVQDKKNEELDAKYTDNSYESKQRRQNDYLQWYETVAETYLAKIEAKLGKVTGVFSVNDMKLIEGILNSSVGGEIEEAREQVDNIKKPNPDGGYVYPVTLMPSDWFEALSTNFSYLDLLESPDSYAQQFEMLMNKKNNLLKKISDFEYKDQSKNVGKAVSEYNAAKDAFDKATEEAAGGYSEGTKELIKVFYKFLPIDALSEKVLKESLKPIVNKVNDKEDDPQKKIDPDKLFDIFKSIDAKQTKYVEASQNVADTARKSIEANNEDFSQILKSTYLDLDNVNSQIQTLQDKIKASAVEKSSPDDYSAKLFPDGDSKRFMEVLINTDFSSMKSGTDKKSNASSSTAGVNFLFGGYCQSNSSSESNFDSFMDSEGTAIEIGFLATKVSCVRNWFNPGVFLLTEDMYNTAGIKISKKIGNASKISSEELASLNDCIFPVFPTAFVVAKDITIKFSFSESLSSENKNMIEEHASKGGGFLCFHGTNSSSSESSHEETCVNTLENSVTIRIPGAQVIGYYMELTPEDRSSDIDKASNGAISITDFAKEYNQKLVQMNKDSKGGNLNA